MANEITIMPRGSTLPTFPSGDGQSRPDNAKMIVGVFVQMSKYLGDIKMNTDKIIEQMPTKDMFENLVPAQKDTLKEKEKEKEQTIGERITKKFDGFAEKTVTFFERIWAVLGPMLLGFIMGITDLTKPMGLLKVALYGLAAFLTVKVLGAILIRGLITVLGKTISFLATVLLNTINRILNRAVVTRGPTTAPIPGQPVPSGQPVPPGQPAPPTGGTGDKPKPKSKAFRAAGGVASVVAAVGLGSAITNEDDSAVVSTAKYLGAGVAVEYAMKNIGKLLPLLARLVPVILTAASVIGPMMASAVAALGPALLVAGTAFAAYKAGGAIYDFAQEKGLTRPAETVIDYATGVTQRSNETYDKGMKASLDEKNKILEGTGYVAKSGGYVAPDGSIVYGKDLPVDLQQKLGLKIAANNDANRISPTPKAVASGAQLDQTRQQAQKAKQTPPPPPPSATNNNVVQTNNVDNKTIITKPPRAERESLSYGK